MQRFRKTNTGTVSNNNMSDVKKSILFYVNDQFKPETVSSRVKTALI
jgi:hypothetical protein